jgi:hypothetical protein
VYLCAFVPCVFGCSRWPFLTSPLALRGELRPQGWNLSPRGNVPPSGEHSLMFRRMDGANREFHPHGITSPSENKSHPWGTTSPLGSKLRMGLCHLLKKVRFEGEPSAMALCEWLVQVWNASVFDNSTQFLNARTEQGYSYETLIKVC